MRIAASGVVAFLNQTEGKRGIETPATEVSGEVIHLWKTYKRGIQHKK